MYNTMTYVCLLGIVLCTPHALRAETLTLEDALTQVLANHPQIDIQQYEIEKAQGQRQTASQWPNPTLDYRREDLRNKGLENGEWTAGMGVPLNKLWTRGARIGAAEAQLQMALLHTIQTRNTLRFAVQKAYVQSYFAQQRQQVWSRVSTLFDEATRIGQVRLAEGDIGHYEQQRLVLEARQYDQREAIARVRWTQYQQRLVLLLATPSGHTSYDLAPVVADSALVIDLSLLEKQALKNRADVLLAQAEYHVRKAEQRVAQRGRWPETQLFVGYKKQTDDFQGVAAELSLELPFFDRRQGEIRRTKAVAQQQIRRAEWQEQQALQEVRQAYARYRLYREQVDHIDRDQMSEQMLDIARYAYGEGEMSLVAWIDAIRAYGETFTLRFELLEQYQLSLFELVQATGTALVYPE
jgi:cobalt-zinc-cadmium efflux system outer membrane protein